MQKYQKEFQKVIKNLYLPRRFSVPRILIHSMNGLMRNYLTNGKNSILGRSCE